MESLTIRTLDAETGEMTIQCSCGHTQTVKAVRIERIDELAVGGCYGSGADFCDKCDEPFEETPAFLKFSPEIAKKAIEAKKARILELEMEIEGLSEEL